MSALSRLFFFFSIILQEPIASRKLMQQLQQGLILRALCMFN